MTGEPSSPPSARADPSIAPDGSSNVPSAPLFRRSPVRYLLQPRYLLAPLVFLLVRLDVGAYWAWGDAVKSPWNGWGCAAANSFCDTGYVQSLPSILPSYLRRFVEIYVLPHFVGIEWASFILVVFMSV